MTNQTLVPAVRVLRGEGLDAVHAAAIAVVGADSSLTHALGDPEQAFFTRSTIKPLQALAGVRAGAFERFGFGAEELALACSSHNGEDRHRAVVERMLGALGIGPEALQCGTHLPIGYRLTERPALGGEDKDPLRHNCSGKHAGFLAFSRVLGAPPERYLDPRGPVQTAVRAEVARACELAPEALVAATDGCSAPNFAMPLRNLAVGFKNLLRGQIDAPDPALARIRDAMQAEPYLVSGERRLDLDIAEAFGANVIAKSGAEAVLAVGFREPELGIAIKVLDGGERAIGPILVEVLKQLGLVTELGALPALARHARPPVFNLRKLRTGELVADFRLERV